MLFGKKDKEKCDSCGTKIDSGYSFCPYCGVSFVNPKKEKEDFGLLGRGDIPEDNLGVGSPLQGFGITDKLIGTVFNSLMKNLDKQFKGKIEENKGVNKSELKNFPNGIKIKIFGPYEAIPIKRRRQSSQPVQKIDELQLKRMSELPREKAKSSVKRIGGRVVYELAASGITSIQDIFVSKIETGYEIKAIGNEKVYVNNIPINLPLSKYSIAKDKLLFEFVSQHEF